MYAILSEKYCISDFAQICEKKVGIWSDGGKLSKETKKPPVGETFLLALLTIYCLRKFLAS
jgi:hypothetical protein